MFEVLKKILRFRSFVFVFIFVVSSPIQAEMEHFAKKDFIEARKCHVIERLQMVYDKKTFIQNRYLILSIKNDKDNYVQCLFQDNDTRLLCEASSGFYTKGGSALKQSGNDYLETLKRLGFSTDASQGNFQRMFDIQKKTDFTEVADILLSVLFELHGARMNSVFIWDAPLAQNSAKICSPVS